VTTPELAAAAGDTAVKQVFDAIEKVLFKRGSVEIDGFGAFELCQRKARRGRNPRTGGVLTIPARVAVKFVPSGALKRRAARLPNVPRGS
jgi:nucleoid DNA-binding protein